MRVGESWLDLHILPSVIGRALSIRDRKRRPLIPVLVKMLSRSTSSFGTSLRERISTRLVPNLISFILAMLMFSPALAVLSASAFNWSLMPLNELGLRQISST